MKRIILTVLLLFSQVPRSPADQLRQTTAAIAAGATTADRRAAITDRLKAAGVDFHVEDFVSGTRTGTMLSQLFQGSPARELCCWVHIMTALRKGMVPSTMAQAARFSWH